MDGERNVLFINRYGSKFFGYSEEELIGNEIVNLLESVAQDISLAIESFKPGSEL